MKIQMRMTTQTSGEIIYHMYRIQLQKLEYVILLKLSKGIAENIR